MGGDTYERELVNTITELDIAAMRAPSSGAATNRNLPDVIASFGVKEKDIEEILTVLLPELQNTNAVNTIANTIGDLSKTYGIELKSGDQTTLYVEDGEVEDLMDFCDTAGAEPRIAARYTQRKHPVKHFLIHPEDARLTDEGNYGLPVKDIQDRAREIITPDTTTKEPNIQFTYDSVHTR